MLSLTPEARGRPRIIVVRWFVRLFVYMCILSLLIMSCLHVLCKRNGNFILTATKGLRGHATQTISKLHNYVILLLLLDIPLDFATTGFPASDMKLLST